MNMTEYLAALQRHDWFYAYSDDHSVWKRGAAEATKLREAQIRLDPLYTLWNEYAPAQFKIKAL